MPSSAELEEAIEWLDHHRGEIPPRLPGEIGTHVEYKPGRIVPVVPLNEKRVGLTNHRDSLQLWLDQGDSLSQTISLRPTEDKALNRIPRKKKKHRS